MNPTELDLVLGYADAFRLWAEESDGEDAERRLLTAKSLERVVSNALVTRYELSKERELTREQRSTLDTLATDFDSVSPDKFLPDGTVVVDCFNWNEHDGSPELAAVVQIEPSGIPF